MQSLKKFYFGKQKVKVPNTFIGGIGATINTPALLASKLGISESRIKLFKVTGVDVECAIVGGSYTGRSDLNADSSMTYYDDRDGLIIQLPGFFIAKKPNLQWVNLPKLKFIIDQDLLQIGVRELFLPELEGTIDGNGNCPLHSNINLEKLILPKMVKGRATINQLFSGCSYLKILYIPLLTILGTDNLRNGAILQNSNLQNLKIYANPSLQTSNAGTEEGDIAYARSQGATIRYVTNFTPPNPVTNLSTGTIYNTAVQLNFTPPTSANGVDFYECYVNGKLMNEIKNSGDFITGLTPTTNYNIRIVAVDMFYNKSELSNSVNVSTSNYDTNASSPTAESEAYITAATIVDSTQQEAVRKMCFQLMNQGYLWGKIQAFYPFLGTTSSQHKWNAKNPLDTNASFRLQFFGGGTHSNLGYQCNGVNAYANTFLIPSAVQNLNSNGLTVTVGTNNTTSQNDVVEIGSFTSATQASLVTAKGNNTDFSRGTRMNGNTIKQINQNDAKGIFTSTRQFATVTKLFKNKIEIVNGNSGGTLSNLNIFIGNLNLNGVPYTTGWTNQRIQFTAIHEGLTDAEVVALHTIINNFETAIGRKTW